MKRRIIVCAMISGFIAPLIAGQQTEKAEGKRRSKAACITQQIMEIERERREAALRNDVPYLEHIMGDDFVGIGSWGNVYDKATHIKARESGSLKLKSIDPLDLKVRVYGITAIVTGTVNVEGSWKTRHFGGTFRFTRVYVRKRGSWKIVSSQLTKVRPP